MNQKKIVLCLFLIVLLALAFMKYPVLADAGWDGKEEREPQGSGTAGDPYLIGTPEELAWYRTEINTYDNEACARLTADIDLNNKNWTPIGQTIPSQTRAFSGEFDGNGHTISGLLIYFWHTTNSENVTYGFFGTVKGVSNTQRASIHDLTLVGNITHEHIVYVSASKGNAGGLCGCATYANISDCTVNVSVNVIEPDSVYGNPAPAGGICGQAADVTITDCVNYGHITGAGNAGGLIGHGYGSLLRCANYGDVQAGKGHAGGLFGYMSGTAQTEPLSVSYCYNVGTITSTGRKGEDASITSDMNAGGNAGGCIGYAKFADNGRTQYIFSHCFSTGSVLAPNYAGSIAGVLWDSAKKVPSISFVDICFLDTACDKTFGTLAYHIDGIPLTASSMTEEQMASLDYVVALNDSAEEEVFVAGKNNPVFTWLPETPALQPGDIDGNGMIDENDVTLVISHVLGFSFLEGEAATAANLNNDDYIDENDVTLLIQIVLQ